MKEEFQMQFSELTVGTIFCVEDTLGQQGVSRRMNYKKISATQARTAHQHGHNGPWTETGDPVDFLPETPVMKM